MQNFPTRRMTQREALLLTFVRRAEPNLVTTISAGHMQNCEGVGWPLARLGIANQDRNRPIGALLSS
jgi:hypothetical protein